ncbi:MAG: hypothetical protein IJS94_00355 [Clostridia bacterium]|nr:hypothetical protein [Clostridia bacterium]
MTVENLKKAFVFLIILQVLLILSSCQFDPYYGKRPFDCGKAKWICEEPSAWFTVDPDAADYHYPKGEIALGERSIEVGFRFIAETDLVYIDLIGSEGSSILESAAGYNELIRGECAFSPEKLIIKIDPGSDTLFNGKYETITFIRTPIGE